MRSKCVAGKFESGFGKYVTMGIENYFGNIVIEYLLPMQ
jgi:hypothetical protein